MRSKYGRTVPTGCGENFDISLVGEDIILPLFIKISLRFARDAEDVVPYRFGGGFDVLVVGAIQESPVNKM